ncbi:MAG: hypothetical protein J6B24_10445, partial [Clostridia bacterium]|nr:hypothetical protein [Clostridia bacterium]
SEREPFAQTRGNSLPDKRFLPAPQGSLPEGAPPAGGGGVYRQGHFYPFKQPDKPKFTSLSYFLPHLPHFVNPSRKIRKNSSKIRKILFTNFKICAILCKVKVTERQMRWVKLSEPNTSLLKCFTRAPPSAPARAGLFFARAKPSQSGSPLII